jgi:hypothetical protein
MYQVIIKELKNGEPTGREFPTGPKFEKKLHAERYAILSDEYSNSEVRKVAPCSR